MSWNVSTNNKGLLPGYDCFRCCDRQQLPAVARLDADGLRVLDPLQALVRGKFAAMLLTELNEGEMEFFELFERRVHLSHVLQVAVLPQNRMRFVVGD